MYKDYIKLGRAATPRSKYHKYTTASNVVSNSANNGGGKLILHYTYNGVANTVTEEMGPSD